MCAVTVLCAVTVMLRCRQRLEETEKTGPGFLLGKIMIRKGEAINFS